ncbi:MAG TPA: glycosyltransferase family 4 protein [Acidimicrobiia bacterium]|nr:glycosyltransferase family 4 protein [Acidimicrobiia bacterium]
MRVAVVSPYAFEAPGGVQDQVTRLVRWLLEEGHEAWAVGPGRAGPAGTRHVGGVVSVPTNRSRAPISVDPRVVGRIREAVEGADLVHVHEPLMPLVGVAAVLRSPVPTVGTFHADVGGIARQAYRIGRPLLRRMVRSMALTTAVSPVAAEAVAGFASPRIVANGLDVDAYLSDADRDGHRVVFLGRDEPRKGLDVLLAAWPAVRAAVPGAELRVLGAERDAPLEGVAWVGRVSEADKRAELASAGVFCAPNLGGESFGIVLVEAMASGCRPVASDLPAFADVVGDAGLLVPAGDRGALASGLIAAIGDTGPEHRAAALERARAFDRPAVLGAYLDAYREALDSG